MYRKQTDAACPSKKDKTEHVDFDTKKRFLFENVNKEPFRVTLRVSAEASRLTKSDAKSELTTGLRFPTLNTAFPRFVQVTRFQFRLGSISAALSCLAKERGLLSRTATDN